MSWPRHLQSLCIPMGVLLFSHSISVCPFHSEIPTTSTDLLICLLSVTEAGNTGRLFFLTSLLRVFSFECFVCMVLRYRSFYFLYSWIYLLFRIFNNQSKAFLYIQVFKGIQLFSSGMCILIFFTLDLRPLMHLEFIFVCGKRNGSNFTSSKMAFQLS